MNRKVLSGFQTQRARRVRQRPMISISTACGFIVRKAKADVPFALLYADSLVGVPSDLLIIRSDFARLLSQFHGFSPFFSLRVNLLLFTLQLVEERG